MSFPHVKDRKKTYISNLDQDKHKKKDEGMGTLLKEIISIERDGLKNKLSLLGVCSN